MVRWCGGLPRDGLTGGWERAAEAKPCHETRCDGVVIQSVPRHCLVDSAQEKRKQKGNEERGGGERARRSGTLALLFLSASGRIAELTQQPVGSTMKTAS